MVRDHEIETFNEAEFQALVKPEIVAAILKQQTDSFRYLCDQYNSQQLRGSTRGRTIRRGLRTSQRTGDFVANFIFHKIDS